MATAPFARRKIDIELELGTGTFGDGAAQKVKLTGLRVEVQIAHAEMPSTGGQGVFRIFGMTLSQMNAASKAGLFWDTRKNYVSVSAGDDQAGMTLIYKGVILEAYPDINPPNSGFFIRASPMPIVQLKPIKPTTFPGTVDAADAMGSMVSQTGFTLENNGISTKLSSPYFPGTAWQQMLALTRAANFRASVDSVNNVIAIWPKTGGRKTGPVTISAATGMIGYPKFSGAYVNIRTLFDPEAKTLPGGPGVKVKLETELKAANGNFILTYIEYHLASEKPGGPWEMALTLHPESLGQSGGL